MTIGFTSMGAPEMTLGELDAIGRKFRMDFIELRTLAGTTNLPSQPVGNPAVENHLPVRVVSSDLKLIEATESDIEAFLRYAEFAGRLGAPFVRVFGGGTWGQTVGGSDIAKAASTLRDCRTRMADLGLRCAPIMETHFAFSSATPCARLIDALEGSADILWDSHHTWALGKESPAETWAALGPWIRHAHYKDSIADARSGKYEHVLPGQGGFPSAGLLSFLSAEFKGGLSLEWEKLWHPDLPELASALSQFGEMIRRI